MTHCPRHGNQSTRYADGDPYCHVCAESDDPAFYGSCGVPGCLRCT